MAEAKHASYYYPRAAMFLHIRLEDFGDKASGLANQWFDIACLANNVTVNLNEYSKADTFSCEIDYKNFPFDPRCIRACGIVIAMEDAGEIFTNTNSLIDVKPTPENTIFIGWADEESISFSDDTRTVRMSGRDNTALLIDRKYLEGNVSVDKPLNVVIKDMLAGLEETKDLTIEIRARDKDGNPLTTLPVLASFWSDKSQLSGKKNVKKDQSYWDVIQELVSAAGMIAYIELDKLIITQPRVLYDRNQAKKFIYGSNLKSLEFKRKIGRKKGFNIAVRCLNVEKGEVITALIPKEATAQWSKETGIPNTEVVIPKMVPAAPATVAGKPQGQQNQLSDQDAEAKGDPAPYIAFSVKNVNSKDQLIEIGQSIYEEIGRQEIEGSFETNEMRIKFTRLDGKEDLFNILKLRVGMPVVVEIKGDDIAAIRNIKNQSGIEKYLVDHKYNPKVARSLSQSIGKSNTPFYTKSVTFTMDSEQGFDCKVEFLNFIESNNPSLR